MLPAFKAFCRQHEADAIVGGEGDIRGKTHSVGQGWYKSPAGEYGVKGKPKVRVEAIKKVRLSLESLSHQTTQSKATSTNLYGTRTCEKAMLGFKTSLVEFNKLINSLL
uniref:Aldedh domain-containing protein n=1 Tax=Ascaris lumbricoides TaxID=6252 RepID=A0A0M3IJD7_ASCLU